MEIEIKVERDAMYETLSEPFVPEYTEIMAISPSEQDEDDSPNITVEADSFLDLLADLERRMVTGNRNDTIARYQTWIERNNSASPALYGAWFNLGVELAVAGDRAGAAEAYRRVLALRAGFYPAAINLGTVLEAAGQPEAALAVWQQALQPEEARAALLSHRNRLAEAYGTSQQDTMKVLLHVGYGYDHAKPPPVFRNAGWREIRLDIDPPGAPECGASMTNMQMISEGKIDAVYLPKAINRLYPHEVPLALREIHRVLKPTGLTFITIADLQGAARYVAEDKLEDPLYMSPAGPIAPLDILYGHRPSLANGKAFVTPRTGFTSSTLAAALIRAGFDTVMVQRDPSAFCLTAIAFRSRPDKEQLARAQAQMLPAADRSVVLYTPAG